jgi:demethylmenaquinone methyltransferase/2-methoxy-6-polyprenyl-1,4-benzoquinol methylase
MVQVDNAVKERFDEIHRHYDFFNHLFSFGLDIGWRNEAARESILSKGSYTVLDIATGTGDFAIAMQKAASQAGKEVRITGTDMNEKMLAHAKDKLSSLGLAGIRLEKGDAIETKYKDSSFDVVTSAFAMRSFSSRLDKFAMETYRITREGGKFVMVDMAMPDKHVLLTKMHFGVINAIGYVAGRKAYPWLTYSISRFDKNDAAQKFKDAGFRDVRVRDLRSGVAFMIVGRK